MKPSEKENAYIAQQEFERRKRVEAEKQKKMLEDEKKKLKELHFMHCPKCGNNLIEIEHNKIKVDKCSKCGGIWLDQGELETIEKSSAFKFWPFQ